MADMIGIHEMREIIEVIEGCEDDLEAEGDTKYNDSEVISGLNDAFELHFPHLHARLAIIQARFENLESSLELKENDPEEN